MHGGKIEIRRGEKLELILSSCWNLRCIQAVSLRRLKWPDICCIILVYFLNSKCILYIMIWMSIVEYFVMFSDQSLSVHGCCCHYRRRFHLSWIIGPILTQLSTNFYDRVGLEFVQIKVHALFRGKIIVK